MKREFFGRGARLGLAAAVAGVTVGGAYWSMDAQAQTQAGRTVWDGVYSQPQATRGRVLYGQKCAVCHGAGLEGADVNPPLAGAAFVNNWRGQTVADLVSRTRTTMPLNAPGTLSASETTDIIAYLMMRNRFPAGSQELARTASAQRGIRITARR